MKPDALSKRKDVRGRVTGHVATIGPVSVIGSTPAKAAELCEAATRAALARLNRGSRIIVWRGHTVVVMPTIYGWDYWIDTYSHADIKNTTSGQDREDAESDALHHLAQHLWSPEVDDEAFLSTEHAHETGLPYVVRDLMRPWIRFQRAYAKLRAEGASDVEAHRKACEASLAPVQP
jgi:hypothetical protein